MARSFASPKLISALQGQSYSPYPPHGAPAPGGPGYGGPGYAPPPGSQYGPPGPAPPATEQQVAAYRQLLVNTIQEKQLQHFYPPDRLETVVQGLARNAPEKVQELMREWRAPQEIAMDIIKLVLFDIILYVDDSGSIQFEENGNRLAQLKEILALIATAASKFDQDGISIRFMNSDVKGDGIRNRADAEGVVARVLFRGLTPMGTNLRNKVLEPMVVGPAKAGQLQKPVLVITITDGQPAGEPLNSVAEAIRYANDELSRTPYGRGAISFQFAQVGNDLHAREFLAKLDEDPSIGGLIDCTSSTS